MAASIDGDAGTIHRDLLNENDGAVIENPLGVFCASGYFYDIT